MENIPAIKIIRRQKGTRINLKLPDSKDENKEKFLKFYITNQDLERMTEIVNTHKDIIVMMDGSSKANPGKLKKLHIKIFLFNFSKFMN